MPRSRRRILIVQNHAAQAPSTTLARALAAQIRVGFVTLQCVLITCPIQVAASRIITTIIVSTIIVTPLRDAEVDMRTYKSLSVKNCIFWLVLVLLLGNAIRLITVGNRGRVFAHRLMPSASTKPVPYTTILRETLTNPDGSNPRLTMEETWAVRGDGSRYVRLAYLDQQRASRVVQFASGREVRINESTETKSTTQLDGFDSSVLHRDPTTNCISSLVGLPFTSIPETIIGEEVVSGYRAVKLVSGTDRNLTMWFALDYGCALLGGTVDFGPSGGVSHKQLVALIPGEPDPSLFLIPSSFVEGPPSKVLRLVNPAATQKLDAYYEAHKPK
jgi:hypothetical protein